VNLTRNYVSQIDRMFTFEEMLHATGQTADEAAGDWWELLDEGRLVEVKGCEKAHYRYRNLPAKEVRQIEYDRQLLKYLSGHPGISSADISVAMGGTPIRTLRRILRRLIDAGKIRRVNGRYWFFADVIIGSIRPRTYADRKKRLAKTKRIWDVIRRNTGCGWQKISQGTGIPRNTLYNYLRALMAEGYVIRRHGWYYPVDASVEQPVTGKLRDYQRRRDD